ncbi:hypothetical protein D3C87_1598190 [compost metagenome]
MVAEIRANRNRNGIEQILGLLVINIHAPRQPVVEKAEIQTGIGRSGLFPFDVLIVGSRGSHVVKSVAELVLGCVGTYGVDTQVRIVGDPILIAGDAVAQTKFQVAERLERPGEFLLVEPPSQRHGWEYPPAVFR